MADEYLDIVDENGNLTGEKELRSICHEKGLWHRTVHVYFFRKLENGVELLVHLRSKNKSSHPNKWDTRFGGHVEAGQTYDEAAERETVEETGLSVELDEFIRGLERSYDGGKNKEFTQVYYYNFLSDVSELSFDDGEVQEVRWMSLGEIESSMNLNPEIWTGSPNGLHIISKDLTGKLK